MILLFLFHAWAGTAQAEVQRLDQEMAHLAQRAIWKGVDRKYRQLMELKGAKVPGRLHLLGAQAARQLGDLGAAHERAQRALEADPSDGETVEEASRWLADFLVNYGEVRIVLAPDFTGRPTITSIDGFGFDPRLRQVLASAEAELASTRRYEGFIPLGRYRIGSTRFDIFGGPRVDVVAEPAPADVAGERVVTLAVRGGGWPAERWPALVAAVQDALRDVEGIVEVVAHQPNGSWLVVEFDEAALEQHGLELLEVASTVQLALDGKLVVVDRVLAFPPGEVEREQVERTVVGFAPSDPPQPIRLGAVATVSHRPTGPFPVPPDRGPVADYRFDVTVRGGSAALDALLPAVEAVADLRPLGLKLEVPVDP